MWGAWGRFHLLVLLEHILFPQSLTCPLWVGVTEPSLEGIRTLGSSSSSSNDLLGVLEQVIAPSTPHILRFNFIYNSGAVF